MNMYGGQLPDSAPSGIFAASRYGNPHAQARRANELARQHQQMTEARRAHGLPADAGALPRSGVGGAPPSGVYGAQHMHQGLPPEVVAQMHDKLNAVRPQLVRGGSAGGRADAFFEDMLPAGAALAPNSGQGYRGAMKTHADMRRRAGGIPKRANPYNMPGGAALTNQSGGGASSFQQGQRPYQPEHESPDRQNYPVHRNLANIYWRLFYKLDPVVGNGIDMYAELPWSDFELVGPGVEGEVKQTYERMIKVCNLKALLPYFVKEYMVLGEVCPHLYYNDNEGIWSHIALHNPDQIEIIHTPFIDMDPIARFKPDNTLQQILTSTHTMAQSLRDSMPPELLSAFMSGQGIELSPLHFSFIPRKMHPYDVRGTSLLSRMWRAFMYEDAIFNASIATARRHAGPLKVAKLGDRQLSWIPGKQQFDQLMQMLAEAEIDPHTWLVYHYGIEFDLVGTTERVMTIDKHWDLIERIKLIALGISKAFLHGEVTYASAQSGLTIFLQRLSALRSFFESVWILPRFFQPVAEMNGWVRPTAAEASSISASGPYIKIRRAHREVLEDERYIVPEIRWERQLDPTVESAQLSAVQSLQKMGVVFTKQYLASLVQQDAEEHLEQRIQEVQKEKAIIAKYPDIAPALNPQPDGGMGGGDLGMMPPIGGGGGEGADIGPGLPPDALGFPPSPDDGGAAIPPAPEGGSAPGYHGGPNEEGEPSGGRQWKRPELFDGAPWDPAVVEDLIRLLEGEIPDEDVWVTMVQQSDWVRDRARYGDPEETWVGVEEWLVDQGYPPAESSQLEAILRSERVLTSSEADPARGRLAQVEEILDASGGADLLIGAPS